MKAEINTTTNNETKKIINDNFDNLFKNYCSLMRNIGFYDSMLIEDAVSYAILKAYDEYTYNKVSLTNYVIGIAKNHYITQLRKEKNSLEVGENFDCRIDENFTTIIDGKKMNDYLKSILSDFDYRIFKMYVDGFTNQEIAKKVNVKANNINVRIFRIIKRLEAKREELYSFV